MTATPEVATVPKLDLSRDEITHRVLALCAETDAITRERCKYSDAPSPCLRGERPRPLPLMRLCYALTSLEKAGLIAWHDDRNTTGTQYAEETPAGKVALLRWDAELFGGAQ